MAKFVRFNVSCGVKGVSKRINEESLIDDKDFKTLSKMYKGKTCYVTELDMADEPGLKERILLSQAEQAENLNAIRQEVELEFKEIHDKEIAELVEKHEKYVSELTADFAAQLLAAKESEDEVPAKRKRRNTSKKKGEES